MPNTSSRPSLLHPTASCVTHPPRRFHPLHGPACGCVCHMFHAALSVPIPKISSRPSLLSAELTGVLTTPPSWFTRLHGPACGRVCQMFQTEPPESVMNVSSRPSLLIAAVEAATSTRRV